MKRFLENKLYNKVAEVHSMLLLLLIDAPIDTSIRNGFIDVKDLMQVLWQPMQTLNNVIQVFICLFI